MGNTRAFWGENYPGPRNWECHRLHFPCTWMVGRSSDQLRWPTRRTAVTHPQVLVPQLPVLQLPVPQLDPAGTGERHRMSTRDPFTTRLIQWVLLCVLTGLPVHMRLPCLETARSWQNTVVWRAGLLCPEITGCFCTRVGLSHPEKLRS